MSSSDSSASSAELRAEETIKNATAPASGAERPAESESYRIWKKNSPYLYDVLLTYALDWPSLTVQYLPGKTIVNNNGKMDYYEKTLLLGTNTGGNEPNYLKLAHLQIPNSVYDASSLDENIEYGQARIQLTVYMRLYHDGEVNRARVHPQNSFLLATKSVTGAVLLFDTTKHPYDPPSAAECRPQLRLTGHESEGFGLSWSDCQAGLLASGSNDQRICLWDIQSTPLLSSTSLASCPCLSPLRTLNDHRSVVEDVCFHHQNSQILFSVSDEGLILVSDLRSEESHRIVGAHTQEINSVSQSPLEEYLFATGSSDRTISVRDLRNPCAPLFVLRGHESEIYRVEWSPLDPRLLLSSCMDGSVRMWDICRTAENGGTIFTHYGHQSVTGDICWSDTVSLRPLLSRAQEPMTVASVSEDNVLSVWQPSRSVYTSLYGEPPPSLPE